jgi:hypothetical protein
MQLELEIEKTRKQVIPNKKNHYNYFFNLVYIISSIIPSVYQNLCMQSLYRSNSFDVSYMGSSGIINPG